MIQIYVIYIFFFYVTYINIGIYTKIAIIIRREEFQHWMSRNGNNGNKCSDSIMDV